MYRIKKALAVIIGTGMSVVTFANETGSETSELARGLGPSLSVQAGYDDNLFSTENSEVDSTVVIVRPGLELVGRKGLSEFKLGYKLEHGRYQQSADDNYTDHQLYGDAFLDLNTRHRVELNAMHFRGHEARGTGATQGPNATANPEPARFTDNSLKAAYEFGGVEAKGRIRLTAGVLDKDFTNFPATNDRNDRSVIDLGGAFYWRVMPKTSAVFELRSQDIDYDLASSDFDSTETKYLVGAIWEATAKTTGSFRIGQSEKEFDSALSDASGATWELGVAWAPRTYSVFEIVAAQSNEEADGQGDYIDTQTFDVNWTHEWSARWRTRVSLNSISETYEGTTREDDSLGYGFAGDYAINTAVMLSLDVNHESRDSNTAGFDYSKNTVLLSLTASY